MVYRAAQEALGIRYIDKGQTGTERTILPLAISYTDRTLTVLAWCCLREAFRMFRVDRIEAVHTAGTSFRPRRAALLRQFIGELETEEARRGGAPA